MKKILALIITGLLALSFTACEQNQIKNDESKLNNNDYYSAEEFAFSNELLLIYNKNNESIGQINHYGSIIQTNDSIIYTKIPTDKVNSITEIDYYRYMIDTKQDIKLGTINNWAQQSTESVCLDEHLYLLITTGEVSDKQNRTVKLLDIDLKNNSIKVVLSEEGGFPYNSMVGVGDKLFIAKVLSNGSCIEEYNIKTNKIKTLIKFDFNDKTTVGETIRQISADEKTIALLMLVKETADSVKLRVDVYDHNLNYIKSVDVTDISSEPNELRQGVSNFQFSNSLFYYENFSSTRFLGEISNNQILKTIETNDTFAMALETENNKTKLFYQSFSPNNNYLYLWNMKDKTLLKSEFYADNTKYYIINMTRNSNDDCLITMYYRSKSTGEKLTPRLYYVNLADLKFEY